MLLVYLCWFDFDFVGFMSLFVCILVYSWFLLFCCLRMCLIGFVVDVCFGEFSGLFDLCFRFCLLSCYLGRLWFVDG